MATMKTIQIQKNRVLEDGEALGIRQNRLAGLLGFSQESKGTVENDTEERTPKQAIELLLEPQNVTFVQLVGPSDKMLFTTALSSAGDAVLYSEKEAQLNLRLMSRSELAVMVADLLAVGTPEKKSFNLTMSRQAAYAVMALADTLKRRRLMDLLLHTISEEEITLQILQEEASYAAGNQDFRWLLPNLLTLTDEKNQPDIKLGLKELQQLAVVEMKKDRIGLTEVGRMWIEDLKDRETIGGLRSLFYHKEQLTLLTGCLIRTGRHLYYMELGEQVSMVMLDREQAGKVLELFLAPGDLVPTQEPNKEPAPMNEASSQDGKRATSQPETVSKQSKAVPKFCRFCGSSLKENAKYCPSCGKQIS